jgi:hypothetical protein
MAMTQLDEKRARRFNLDEVFGPAGLWTREGALVPTAVMAND